MWVIVEVPWRDRVTGEKCQVAHQYLHPWALGVTIGVAVQREARRHGVTLSNAQVDGIVRSLRISPTLELT